MKSFQNGCPFCFRIKNESKLESVGTVVAIPDKHPVTVCHTLVIPRRHTPDYFTMTEKERKDAESLVQLICERILKKDPSVEGFNIGVNCGLAAGQTVMHAHIHVIPRRTGDIPNPRGGVRGVIPGKMDY